MKHFSRQLYIYLQDLTQMSPFSSNTFNDSDVPIRTIINAAKAATQQP